MYYYIYVHDVVLSSTYVGTCSYVHVLRSSTCTMDRMRAAAAVFSRFLLADARAHIYSMYCVLRSTVTR